MADERLTEVKAEEASKLAELNSTYTNMIDSSDQNYNGLIDQANDYGTTQAQLQQQQSDLAVQEVNQNKALAQTDYTKEQKASYGSYTKATDKYGANGEQVVSSGLAGSGYSESVKGSIYNTYQNRYATAKESYSTAVLNYNNLITEAQLANSVSLAEIAYNTLQTQLTLTLEAFQYKNTLLESQLSSQLNIQSLYNTKYEDVLSQLNTEASLAEEQRQYNLSLAESQRQYNSSGSTTSSGGNGGLVDSSTGSNNYTATQKAANNAYAASAMSDSEQQAKSVANGKSTTSKSSTSSSSLTSNSLTGWSTNWRSAIPSGVSKTYTKDYLLSKGYITSKVVNGKIYYKAK